MSGSEPATSGSGEGSKDPGLFYGWVMLGVAMGMAIATMPAQTVLVSLWKEPLRLELGLSLTAVSAAYSIGTVLAGLPLPWVGRVADRMGLRFTVALVSLAYCATLALVPFAGGIVVLGATFFFVRFLGQGSLGMLSGHVIAMWFERKLGRVHALLAVFGFALGSAAMPQPTAWLLGRFGYEVTMWVLAGFVFVLTVPGVLLVFKNRPEDIGQHLDGDPVEHAMHDVLHGGAPPPSDPAFTVTQAAGTRAFWILMLNMMMTGFVGTALIFHMVDMLKQAGIAGTPAQAAWAIQPWPIAFGVATLGVGWLVDRYHPARVLPMSLVLMAAGVLICLGAMRGMAGPERTVLMMAVGMGVYGASQAVIVGVANPTIARYFGRTHHGAIRGTIATATVVGTGGGPYALALAYDLAGKDFTVGYLICVALTVPLFVGAVMLRQPPPPPCPPTVQDRTPEPDEVDPAGPVQ